EARRAFGSALADAAGVDALERACSEADNALAAADRACAAAGELEAASAAAAQAATLELTRLREQLASATREQDLRRQSADRAAAELEAALELLRQRFGDAIPADVGVRLAADLDTLSNAADAVERARAAREEARSNLTTADGRVAEAARQLSTIDVQLQE